VHQTVAEGVQLWLVEIHDSVDLLQAKDVCVAVADFGDHARAPEFETQDRAGCVTEVTQLCQSISQDVIAQHLYLKTLDFPVRLDDTHVTLDDGIRIRISGLISHFLI
jgi:hypothetical protein